MSAPEKEKHISKKNHDKVITKIYLNDNSLSFQQQTVDIEKMPPTEHTGE